MLPEDQPTILTPPPNGSRPASVGWQAPSVEEMQAMLPQYEVLEVLGRGGMGAVYKARQKSLKRLVAIKILPLGMADDEFKFAERFRNEAETMAAMNHPAIVGVYDFGETADGLLYFIMEFVDGTDVQKMIAASGRLSSDYALSISAHVCDALGYAHARGVIHRDIKPANILIDQEGRIKVADFGLAKMNDPSMTSGLTKTGTAMGTPDYVAPEVLSPGMVADHRADIYAVGVMLYQMLTGEVPRGMFKLPSQKGIGSDPRYDEIICKAMEQDREERYQSATEVRQALDVILTTPQAKNDASGSVSVKKATAAASEASMKKASQASWWLISGGIAAVLGLAAFFMFGGQTKEAATVPKTPAEEKGSDLVDLLALVDVKRDALGGEWSRDGGDLLVKAGKTAVEGSPRLQLPYQPPEEYDCEIEFTPESGDNKVVQILSAYQRPFTWQIGVKLNAGMKAGFTQIDGKSLFDTTDGTAMRPSFLTNGQRHRSTVEVRRTGLRGLLDGKQVASWGSNPKSYQSLDIHPHDALRDARHLGIGGYDRVVRFHKITVREITGTGKMDAGNTAAVSATVADTPVAPQSANWTDLMPMVRQKASSRTGLVVEPDAVRQTGGEEGVSMRLDGVEKGDRMVRVRYLGETQVSLWPSVGGGGSAYVLVQRGVTMFRHQATATSATVALREAVPHPLGFDSTQPHELLVSVQGSILRAWLDGRFIGEVDHPAIKDTQTGLNFGKGSAVQKVEAAVFSTSSSSSGGEKAQWQPIFNNPADFGGDLRDVEFRDGATFIKGRTFRAPADPAIVGIRSTMRYLDGDRTGSLTIRSTESAKYGDEAFALTASIAPKGTTLMVKMRDRSSASSELGRHDFPLSPALKEGELFSFELRAESQKITVIINEREVGSLDDTWAGAVRSFGITPSSTEMTEFRDVAVRSKTGG